MKLGRESSRRDSYNRFNFTAFAFHAKLQRSGAETILLMQTAAIAPRSRSSDHRAYRDPRLPSLTRLLILAGALAYIGAFFASYVLIISPNYDYIGYVYRPNSTISLVLAAALAAIPSTWMPIRLSRPSQIIYLILYFVVVIPAITMPVLAGVMDTTHALGYGFILVCALLVLRCFYEMPLVNLPALYMTRATYWLLFSIASATLYAIVVSTFPVSLEVPSLADVYTQRAEFRAGVTGVTAYAFFWLAKAVNPYLMAKGYLDRNLGLFTAGFAGQILLFAISGLRSILFSVILLAGVLIALRGQGRQFGNWIAWGLTALILMTLVLDSYLGATIASSLFVRRLIATAGLNTTYFFDFYSQNPLAYLDHSILGPFVETPYDRPPALVIGDAYYSGVQSALDTSANANLWADGYANFGISGVAISTLVLGILFLVTDSLARRKSIALATLMLSYPAYMLVNTALQTALITHGIVFVLALLYLQPRERHDKGMASIS